MRRGSSTGAAAGPARVTATGRVAVTFIGTSGPAFPAPATTPSPTTASPCTASEPRGTCPGAPPRPAGALIEPLRAH
ncbi:MULTISPECIES: hypothetical protein [Streptomyces]|uniref:Uncharacterized protein n=1 Tax=Streptomyces siderophoricus TaxID=2802281 RepID=A0ABS1N3A3_9ACTN|nr:hypothetical protein [Streptomyces sp. 9-7]MBL1094547.1 hypothetical protein [Streptomyces sp. 9-7]